MINTELRSQFDAMHSAGDIETIVARQRSFKTQMEKNDKNRVVSRPCSHCALADKNAVIQARMGLGHRNTDSTFKKIGHFVCSQTHTQRNLSSPASIVVPVTAQCSDPDSCQASWADMLGRIPYIAWQEYGTEL